MYGFKFQNPTAITHMSYAFIHIHTGIHAQRRGQLSREEEKETSEHAMWIV